MRRAALALAVLAGTACTSDPNGPRRSVRPDFDFFVCRVHPLVQAGCSMARCHGTEATAMRVHSPGVLRFDPPDGGMRTAAYRVGDPLSREELNADYNSLRMLIDPENVEASAPLHKPLHPGAGGGWHGGGVLYGTKDDPTYQAIVQWVRGAKATQLTGQEADECQRVLQRSLSW